MIIAKCKDSAKHYRKTQNEKCARKLNSKYRKAAKKVTGKMRKWRGMENYIPGIQWYALAILIKWKARVNCKVWRRRDRLQYMGI